MPQIVYANKVSNTLQRPFRLLVGGSSGSGKTELVKKMIHENYFGERFNEIHYCYPAYLESVPAEFDVAVQYHAGLLSISAIKDIEDGSLVIIDDLMMESAQSEAIAKLFTVCARKRGISIILLTQNIYMQGKHFRNIRLNATAIIMFKYRAGQDVNKRLLRDLGLQHVISINQLQAALSERYSYVLFDLHPNLQSDFGCVRSNIFSKNFRVFFKMEYVAIPKDLFIKYFQIIDEKNGKIKAIKDEIEIKKSKKHVSKSKKSKKRKRSESRESRESKKRQRSESRESTQSETSSESYYTDSE